MEGLDDMRNGEKVGLTIRKAKKTFQVMLNTLRDSLSDLASIDDGEDADDEEDNEYDIQLGKLSKDDKPS